MAQIPQVQNYGIPALDYSGIGNTLSALGQQVGQQLAAREYQRQAQTALPALQATYKNAFDKIGQGNLSEGYGDLMDAQLQYGSSTNPFIQNMNQQMASMSKQFADDYLRKSQIEAYNARSIGGGGTIGGIPAISPQQAAENVLLTQNQNTPMTGGGTETIEIDPQTGQPIATLINQVDAETPLPEMEGVAQPDPSTALTNIAKTAKSEKFKSALMEVAKYPPTKETENDFRQSVQNYFALKNEEKKSVIDSYTSAFKGRKEAESTMGKDFYRVEDADRILGKQYEGLILKPSVEAKGTTIGKSQSVTYGTNADDLRRFEGNVSGSVSELNQGKVGNFISNNGGVFNLDKETVEEEVKNKYMGSPQKEKVTYLFNKNNPDNRIKILDDSQVKAFDMLTIVPAELQRLTNRGATASLVAVERPTTKGPTREAVKTMPQGSTKKLSPMDQQALDWANANSNDRRAKQIKQRLGI
jgi:hypothetical protein